MTTGRPHMEAPGLSSAGPLAWVAYELEGECYAPVPRVSTITLRLEARKRIAAARLHLAEGFRALDDASRRFTNPSASKSLPAVTPGVAGANCPEVRSKRPRGPSFGRLPVVLHAANHGGDQWNIPPVKMGENP
jgi:hypothetical protein